MSTSRKRRFGSCGLAAVVLLCSVAVAQNIQEDIEDHFKPLPDGTYRFTNNNGTGINRDYYIAPNRGPINPTLLFEVERAHVSQQEWDDLAAGRYDGALKDVKYTLRRFPNHPTSLTMLSTIAKATDRHDLAVRYFDHALKLYPQYAFSHALYGKYLVDVGAFELGIDRLKTATATDGRLGKIHGWLAEAYAKNGQMELAQGSATAARGAGYRGRISGVKED